MTTRLADEPSDDMIDAWHAVASAVQAHDFPDEPPVERSDTAGHLLVPALRSRHIRFAFIEHGHPLVLAGIAGVRLFTDQDTTFVETLAVRPRSEERRVGKPRRA